MKGVFYFRREIFGREIALLGVVGGINGELGWRT
jgi:hypothetical protein